MLIFFFFIFVFVITDEEKLAKLFVLIVILYHCCGADIHKIYKSFNNIRFATYIYTLMLISLLQNNLAASYLIFLPSLHSKYSLFSKREHIGSLVLINATNKTSSYLWWWNKFFLCPFDLYLFVELQLFVFVTMFFSFFFCKANKKKFFFSFQT